MSSDPGPPLRAAPRAPAAPPDPRRGPAREVDNPKPGFFLIRLVKKGPWVPARIQVDWGRWWAEIDGKRIGTPTEDVLTADAVLRIWHFGRVIDEAEYRRRLALPAADRPDPHKPVDLRKKESLF